MLMKNSNGTIGNQARDLPAYSAMPQPTAPPGAPGYNKRLLQIIQNLCTKFLDKNRIFEC